MKLAELVSTPRRIEQRYAAVALRNEYIKLSQKEQTRAAMRADWDEVCAPCECERTVEQIVELKLAISELNAKQRSVLKLRYFYGFSVAEIAGIKGVTRQAVNGTLKRGLDNLRALL